MKISQKIEFGQIDHTHLSLWKSDCCNPEILPQEEDSKHEVELHRQHYMGMGDDVVVFTMTTKVMRQLHKALGSRLKKIAEDRRAEARIFQKMKSDLLKVEDE